VVIYDARLFGEYNMAFIIVPVSGKFKKYWKEFLKGSHSSMSTGMIIRRLMKTYASPLGSILENNMSKRAVCHKCGRTCDVVYKKREGLPYQNCSYSACCNRSFSFYTPRTML